MKKFFLPCLFIFFFLFNRSLLFPQNIPFSTEPLNDQSNNIRAYLTRVACEVTENSLSGFTTLTEWQAARTQRYNEFIDMMSLTDVPLQGNRPPLNVKITGSIQKNGYKIKKLYYESLPSLYVPANLYIPDKINKPVPAILYVCGHARTQKVHYQAHARRFAELGFVCLIIETIQWGEVLGEHWGCYVRGWFHWYSRGYTPGGVELWNAIRGLDLLCQLQEVNRDQLGVTGISGGGSQTWYIAAADPRVKAAAPVCGTSTVKAHIFHRTIDGHCDCMMPINTYLRDYHDIGALIAPRPLLIASADRDRLNTIESVRESFQNIKKIYELYGQPENITLIETPGGHSYHKTSRTKIFSFFLKHLFNRDVPYTSIKDIDESENAQLSEEELRVYINGTPPDDRTKTIQETFMRVAEPPEISGAQELKTYRTRVLNFLTEKTFHGFAKQNIPFSERLEFRSLDGAAFGRKTYSFVAEKDWRLKVDIRYRNSPEQKNPVILVLQSPNEQRWESEEFVSGLDENYNIAYFETRGVGENGWSPEMQWHVRRAAAWTGRTIASMRVYDILSCLQFLRTFPGIENQQIAIAARGEMCVPALYAALLDEHISAVVLQNPAETQNKPGLPDGRGETIEMLNCLRITDLPQVAGLLFPAKIVFVGAMPDTYSWTKSLYQTLGKKDNFQVVNNISEWSNTIE